MASKKTRTRTLTIFLIKKGLAPRDVIPRRDELTTVPLREGSRSLGTLYVRKPQTSRPRWLSFFAGYGDISRLGLRNASTSAVLLTRRGGRLFAITFGYGRHLLAPGVWEENFGLRTTLNMVDADRIRSIDRKRFDAISRHSREQASREGSIEEFGLDIEQDLLRALVGTPRREELGKRVAGMDALTPSVDVELAGLPDLLVQYAGEYRRRAYRKTFPWVDHIAEVRDPRVKEPLDEQLMASVASGSAEKCWLAVPTPVNWGEVGGFLYTAKQSEEPKPDLHLRDFLETVRDSVELTADYARQRQVRCVSADGDQPIERWTVYQCLYAEVSFEGEMYLLSGGSWYRVEPKFVDAVSNYVRRIPKTTVSLPPYDDASEGAYNQRVARASGGQLALMDAKNISYGGGPSKIEFCDLYSRSKTMLHVKRYHGSSVMSHLFAQGLVAGQAFLQSADFRKKLNSKLPAAHKLSNTERRPRAETFEVAYGIVSRSERPLELPFFSKVSLRHATQQLRTLGYKVTVTKIPVDGE